jgi:transcriptional regulator with XRE-family HTH domain
MMDVRMRPDRLRYERRRRFMTQEELAEAAGFTPSTISRIESGNAEPRLSTIKRLAAALGIDPADLIEDPSRKTRKEKI